MAVVLPAGAREWADRIIDLYDENEDAYAYVDNHPAGGAPVNSVELAEGPTTQTAKDI